jgi:hypothetical protein
VVPSKIDFIYAPCWGITLPWTTCSDYGSSAGISSSYAVRFHARYAGQGCVVWMDGHVKAMQPVYRVADPTYPTRARQTALSIGAISKVFLPTLITSSDPKVPDYNYYFSLDKVAGQ